METALDQIRMFLSWEISAWSIVIPRQNSYFWFTWIITELINRSKSKAFTESYYCHLPIFLRKPCDFWKEPAVTHLKNEIILIQTKISPRELCYTRFCLCSLFSLEILGNSICKYISVVSIRNFISCYSMLYKKPYE